MKLLCSENWALCFWAVLRKSPIMLLRKCLIYSYAHMHVRAFYWYWNEAQTKCFQHCFEFFIIIIYKPCQLLRSVHNNCVIFVILRSKTIVNNVQVFILNRLWTFFHKGAVFLLLVYWNSIALKPIELMQITNKWY